MAMVIELARCSINCIVFCLEAGNLVETEKVKIAKEKIKKQLV